MHPSPPALRPLSAIRDSLEERQSNFVRRRGGRRAKQLAFDHPVLRQLVAGQAFSFEGVAEWSRCNGRRIGAVLRLRLVRPVSFDGQVPVRGNDDTDRAAYLEGIGNLRVEGATNFDVYVDLNRRRARFGQLRQVQGLANHAQGVAVPDRLPVAG